MTAETFPFAALRAAAAPDRGAQLAARLARTLAALVPEPPLSITAAPLPPAGERVALAMRRSDGLGCAIDVAPQFAEALVSLSLGGSFTAASERSDTLTPSERQAQRRIVTACLDAVDAVWPAEGASWQAAAAPVAGAAHGFELRAGDVVAVLALTIASDAPAPDAAPGHGRADMAWARGMRALLGATGLPLRAVLHERQIPLDAAIRLAPGDVLPIETPREVQLRIGTHRIARGTIAPQDDDGALIVTITSRRPDPATLASLEEPS